jgi:hypothetical protein
MAMLDTNAQIKHISEKWGQRACPMCGKGPWNVGDRSFQLTEFNGGNMVVGGPVIPVFAVTCANCAHVVLVNSIVAGLQPTG